jgi:hypothetical protein
MTDFMAAIDGSQDEDLQRRLLASPLAEWLSINYDRAAEPLKRKNMCWAIAAETFRALGLKDHRNLPPTAETARETWLCVEARRTSSDLQTVRSEPGASSQTQSSVAIRPGWPGPGE